MECLHGRLTSLALTPYATQTDLRGFTWAVLPAARFSYFEYETSLEKEQTAGATELAGINACHMYNPHPLNRTTTLCRQTTPP